MTELSNLLDKIKEVIYDSFGREFYDEVRANIANYNLLIFRPRTETRELGKHNIPGQGKIITYVDNEWYDEQDEQFKERFPLLNSPKPSAIVEQVKDVYLKDKDQVELRITRYLIQEK